MKKIIVASGLIVTIICAVLISKFIPYKVRDRSIDIKNTVINQDIVFIRHYTNLAWGYQSNGSFIDKEGNVYKFDFSDLPRNISLEEKIQKFQEIRENEKPVSSDIISDDDLKYLYELLGRIDINAGFNKESVACDAGQYTLYGIRYKDDGSPELVMIYSYGDWINTPEDDNALKLCKYWTGCQISKR